MKQVLIAAIRISGSFLAKKIAEDNPAITVHLIGPRIKGTLPKNFLWIGEEVKAIDLANKIKKIHDSYDFIYANELPLQSNIEFQNWKQNISIPVFCSDKEISFLEFSKISTKKILKKLFIPNADYEEIKIDDWGRIIDFEDNYYRQNKFVLKMDRSLVSTGFQSMISSYNQYKNQISVFESFTANFFAEKFIKGKEFSAHFLCNGSEIIYLGSARDYKKQYENDQGPNTGSTGCYSPVEYVDNQIELQVLEYANKILDHLKGQNIQYRGIMYLGCLIDQNNQVNVLEINTRCGNPEFCTIANTIETDLLNLFYSATVGEKIYPVKFNNQKAVSLNIIHKNYSHFPHTFSKQPQILENEKFIMAMYHPMIVGYNYFANITRISDSVENSAKEIVSYLDTIDLGDYTYRKDIGVKNV